MHIVHFAHSCASARFAGDTDRARARSTPRARLGSERRWRPIPPWAMGFLTRESIVLFTHRPSAATIAMRGVTLERYEMGAHIGGGTFGEVSAAVDLVDGSSVAIKRVRFPGTLEEGVRCTRLREVEALRQLEGHPNVVQLVAVVPSETALALVMELVEGMTLRRVMQRQGILPLALQKCVAAQLLEGLAHCHAHRIVHRDVKPANVLVSWSGVVKLCDFGLARRCCARGGSEDGAESACEGELTLRAPLTPVVSTLWYRAPETLFGSRRYGCSIDLWSAGMVIAELACGGEPLFPGLSEIDQIASIMRVKGTPTLAAWPELAALPDFGKIELLSMAPVALAEVLPDVAPRCVDLIERLSVYNPRARICAAEARRHPHLLSAPHIAWPEDLGAALRTTSTKTFS